MATSPRRRGQERGDGDDHEADERLPEGHEGFRYITPRPGDCGKRVRSDSGHRSPDPGHGQQHPEHGVSGLRREFDVTAVVVNDAARHVESQARTQADGLRREERFEHARTDPLGNAGPIVGDSNQDRITPGGCGDRDVTLITDGIEGIVHQLLPHLIDLGAEPVEARKTRSRFEVDDGRFRTGLALEHGERVGETARNVHLLQHTLAVHERKAFHCIDETVNPRGGGFDLPPVHPLFENYVQQHGLSDRLRFYPGNFFHDPLPIADVLVMGRVLHNWDMATKRMLLTKAYQALPNGGALVVYERMIDDERRTHAMGLLSSQNMLIMTAGGFDYTSADCIGWMQEAGFHNMRVEPLTIEQSMVIGVR